LSAGHVVVATGRDAAKVTAAMGDHDSLLAITLDVTVLAICEAVRRLQE
jgi:hypothetical protein